MPKQIRLNDLSELKQLLPQPLHVEESEKQKPAHDGRGQTVRVSLDTQGRKGKVVTLISGFHHNPETMEKIAKILKQHCGAGGTVRGMVIEIQGDQRGRVSEMLREMNYIVK